MLSRLFALFRRTRLDRELDDEVRFHLDGLESELHARGLSPEEARLAARREFGAVESMKETYRDQRGLRWLHEIAQDLRIGLRGLRKNPGFAAAAVLSLALGIGVNAVIFSLFHALLLQQLPVQRPHELVSLYRTGGWGKGYMSFPLYQDLQNQTDVFDGVLARSSVMKTRMGGERAEFVGLEYVSGNYFSVLGVRAAAGRVLSNADSKARGVSPVAVLSYDAWRNRFGLDAGIVGRTIVIDERPFTVVGVAQPVFRGVETECAAEVWVPLTMSRVAFEHPGSYWLWALARRKPGVPDEKIAAAVNTVVSRYLAFHYGSLPESGSKHMAMEQRIEVRPGGLGISLMREEFEKPLRLLMAAVLLVLLVACANVAGLLLARGAARRREMALRLSLGAGRWRLVRQWLTESAILAAAGAALGWAFAALVTPPAARLLPGIRETDALPAGAGGAVLMFVAAAAALSAILFGVVAGLGSTAVETAPALREGGAGAVGGRLRVGVRRAMVVAQVALSVVLVVTAGLFGRSLAELRALDLGFHNYGVLTFHLDAPKSYSAADRKALPGRFLDRVRVIPGVISASAGFPGPYQGGSYSGDVFVPDVGSGAVRADVARQTVYPRFFEAIGCPLLSGRDFTDRDRPGSRKVAVVNQAFAEEFLGGQDPVGRVVGLNFDGPAEIVIVGAVRNMRHDDIRTPAVPVIYIPQLQEQSSTSFQYLVRAGIPERDLLRLLRHEVAALDPGLAIGQPQTVQSRIDRSVFRERMLAGLGLSFGVLALALAVIGLYGVVAYVVTLRTAEIGVRIALGAQPAGVLWMVLREALLMVAAGVLIGGPASLAAARMARTLLFGVRPQDPAVICFSIASLLAAGLCAGILPARRAAAIDPVQALRTE